ncbi:hypothetical protein SMD44_08661 [Streptomyces alboflavus]|uniref:Uncharacterized protein n=1 Tax=Streptomyces alboflavus TaxID=67267 RepID=A0A1Z1WS07_9ACTN|nr:hypothetical protein SMD44_08661 [Streptomyces alboflavus]
MPRRYERAPAVVAHLHVDPVVAVGQPYLGPCLARVLAGVGEGLLDDAEDGEAHGRWQRALLAVDAEVGGQPREAGLGDDAIEVVGPGLGRGGCVVRLVVRPQYVEELAHLAQRHAAGVLQGDQGAPCDLGVVREVGPGAARHSAAWW